MSELNSELRDQDVEDAAEDADFEGEIKFLGLWRDTGDRAMPIKMNVNPGNPNQMAEATQNLINELLENGGGRGLVAF